MHLDATGAVPVTQGLTSLAAAFNGSSQYLSRPANDTALQMGDVPFTICAWAYLDQRNTRQTIVAKYDTTSNQREYWLLFRGDGTTQNFTFTVSSNGVSSALLNASNFGIPGTAPDPSARYFVVAWHDPAANTTNIQVDDGVPNTLPHSAGVHVGTSRLYVGARPTPTDYFDGVIQRVGVWKRLLSADERTYLFNNKRGRDYPFV